MRLTRPVRRLPRTLRLRRLLPVLSLVLACGLLTGCWDRRELEDTGFVLAMGMDAAGDGKVTVTVQIAVPRTVGAKAGGTPDTPPVLVEQVTDDTVSEAVRTLENFTSRRISFAQLKVVILGRRLAQQGVTPFIGTLTRNREMRRSILMMVSETTAEAILTVKPEIEREPASFLEDLTRRAREETGQAPRQDLHRFLKGFEGLGMTPTLPLIQVREIGPGLEHKAGNNLELAGTAVFKAGHMVGELDREETELYLFMSGHKSAFMEAVPVPGKPEQKMVFTLQPTGRKYDVSTAVKRPRIRLHTTSEAELREVERAPEGFITPEGIGLMEQALSEQLTRESNAVIKKLQNLGADAIGFGEYAKMRFWDWPSWCNYDWPTQFPQADIQVTSEAQVRRVGMTFQPTVPLRELGTEKERPER